MTDKPVVFLDFDGVICDSINECFVSSWLAYDPASKGQIDLEAYRLFRSYRPFIRRGGDYLLLQRCVHMGIPLTSQKDFDKQESLLGEDTLDEFHAAFYRERETLLSEKREYWLGLSVIYRGIGDALRKAAGDAWILTTKKADFAYEIARSHGLMWDREKIICSGKRRKLDVIGEIIGDRATEAVFIDDQIDHFTGPIDPRVSCYLASWGYIVDAWLDRGIEVINRKEFSAMVDQWYR